MCGIGIWIADQFVSFKFHQTHHRKKCQIGYHIFALCVSCKNRLYALKNLEQIFPLSIFHLTVCAKRQPSGSCHYHRMTQQNFTHSSTARIRALKAFYKHGCVSMAFNSTRREETFWPALAKSSIHSLLDENSNKLKNCTQSFQSN